MATTSFYRAVWRWHFYAGLIVLPVLCWLATTGALYLYKPEIEQALYAPWTQRHYAGDPIPLADMVRAVEIQTKGRVTRIERPADGAASWRMGIRENDGAKRTAFVDPAFGLLLGSVAGGGIMETVKQLHSLAITGPIGNTLVEIVAGWTILLCITGFILWWPRRGAKALALRGHPRQRGFWRDFHASTGALVGAVILFLAVTGMPWSGMWGGWLRDGINTAGLGRPAAPSLTKQTGHEGHDEAQAALPWAMRDGTHPMAHAGHAVGPDGVAAIAVARGLGPGWTLVFPKSPGAPWQVSAPEIRAQDARVIQIDPGTGTVLADTRYADFGVGARAIEWGIATHQGEEYGEANRLVMLAGCIGVWLLALSAPILWWKRRRSGHLSAPPRAIDAGRARAVAVAMLAIGMLFPLTGATMVVALLSERYWPHRT